MSRRPRQLSRGELALWREVVKHVPRLKAEPKPKTEPPEPLAMPDDILVAPAIVRVKPKTTSKKGLAGLSSVVVATAPPAAQKLTAPSPKLAISKPGTKPAPPLAPLERKLRRQLARGSHPIHAALDLHGMRQYEAHDRLRSFLHRAQADGASVVLVVTGKGARSKDDPGLLEERGVLRRMVPQWLRLPDLRGLVVGFEEAAQHQGGGGALYIRLRRSSRGESGL